MSVLGNLKISLKLPVLIVTCALVTGAAVGTATYLSADSSLWQEASANAESQAVRRATTLKNYLEGIKTDLSTVASNPYTAETLAAFTAAGPAFPAIGRVRRSRQNTSAALHHRQPNKAGREAKSRRCRRRVGLVGRARGAPCLVPPASARARLLRRVSGRYDRQRRLHVFKEPDFATNLVTGAWKDSNFAGIVREALAAAKAGRKDAQFFADFAPYAPSNGGPRRLHSSAGLRCGR